MCVEFLIVYWYWFAVRRSRAFSSSIPLLYSRLFELLFCRVGNACMSCNSCARSATQKNRHACCWSQHGDHSFCRMVGDTLIVQRCFKLLLLVSTFSFEIVPVRTAAMLVNFT